MHKFESKFVHIKRSIFGRFIFYISIIFLLISFSSCGKKKSNLLDTSRVISTKKQSQNELEKFTENVVLKEARFSDIPIPVGYKFIELDKIFTNKKAEFLCCVGDLDNEKLLNYYKKNLELNGWLISDFSNEYEGLLVCKKKNRKCVISIREKMEFCKILNKNNCVCISIKDVSLENEILQIKDINSKTL